MQPLQLRDFSPVDTTALNDLGVSAFEQYSGSYDDWPSFKAKISAMSSLAEAGEVIVALIDKSIVGAVAYIGPQKPKSTLFPVEWAVMRMLVVSPSERGKGIGRALAEECIQRARRDHAQVVGLHTSAIMSVALPLYLTMGFMFDREVPPIHGVPYGIYRLQISG